MSRTTTLIATIAGLALLAPSGRDISAHGGGGSPTALYLAAAGVGTIGIVDFDDVDLSNLQRQSLYDEADVLKNLPKAIALGATNRQSPKLETLIKQATSVKRGVAKTDISE